MRAGDSPDTHAHTDGCAAAPYFDTYRTAWPEPDGDSNAKNLPDEETHRVRLRRRFRMRV